MVCLVEEDYLGFLSAVSDATFGEYDHFALLDHLEDGAYTLVLTTSLGTKQRESQGKRSRDGAEEGEGVKRARSDGGEELEGVKCAAIAALELP